MIEVIAENPIALLPTGISVAAGFALIIVARDLQSGSALRWFSGGAVIASVSLFLLAAGLSERGLWHQYTIYAGLLQAHLMFLVGACRWGGKSRSRPWLVFGCGHILLAVSLYLSSMSDASALVDLWVYAVLIAWPAFLVAQEFVRIGVGGARGVGRVPRLSHLLIGMGFMAHGLFHFWGAGITTLEQLGVNHLNLETVSIHVASIFTSALLVALVSIILPAIQYRSVIESLQKLAHADSLTGLPNRREFENRYREAVGRSQRHGGAFCVALVDLDGFKEVNDNMGHLEGDRVLKVIADSLQSRLRSIDVIARIGGDEFGLLIADSDSRQSEKMLDRVLRQAKADQNEKLGWAVDASVGVAVYGEDGETLEALLQVSDRKMYEAKRQDRPLMVV